MDSFFQTFVAPFIPVSDAPVPMDLNLTSTSDDVDTFLIDLPWTTGTAQVTTQVPKSQEADEVPVSIVKPEKENEESNRTTFDIANIDKNDDNDDGNDWNIRSDDEEKNHVYYTPPGAYRSYVLGSGMADENQEKEGSSEQLVSNHFEVESPNKLVDDDDDDDDWNVRGEDEEKYFVYQVPSGAYRSYELGQWKKENEEDSGNAGSRNENDEKLTDVKEVNGGHDGIQDVKRDQGETDFNDEGYRAESQSQSSSSETQDDFGYNLDMTTPQSMANRPRVRTQKVLRGDLCRVCRNFHGAKNERRTEKRGKSLIKKLLLWRKKSRNQPCGNCGLAVDRRSFVKRIFAVGRKTGGTY